MDPISIKIDLGIPAYKFIQQVQIHNQTIEEQVSKGIEAALNELADGDNFVNIIKNETILSLKEVVNKYVFSYQVRENVRKLIEEKISVKLNEFADKIAEQVVSAIGDKELK